MEAWQDSGAALEMFEDCLLDIDAWIQYALDAGYRRIFLQGHSLGTEKVVYYLNKGRFTEKVVAVILLGISDSFGNQARIAKTFPVDPMEEAYRIQLRMMEVKESNGQVVAGKKIGITSRAMQAMLGVSEIYLDIFSRFVYSQPQIEPFKFIVQEFPSYPPPPPPRAGGSGGSPPPSPLMGRVRMGVIII